MHKKTNCVLKVNFQGEFPTYHLMPMHYQACIGLKPEERWKRTCTVEKWLCNSLCQSKEIAILDMPLSNQTPPSLDSHKENSKKISRTLYTFSHMWSTVTLGSIFSCLNYYHFSLNEVFMLLCNIYASLLHSLRIS